LKRYWCVTLKDGTKCTMIIEEPCTAEEAFIHAVDRFDKRVLMVE
jgi:hypothetical protein